jgi:hypothetical protein
MVFLVVVFLLAFPAFLYAFPFTPFILQALLISSSLT